MPPHRPGAGSPSTCRGQGRARLLDRRGRGGARGRRHGTALGCRDRGAAGRQRYRLAALADGIGDNPSAVTRFVQVSRPGLPGPPTGADKTSLVAFIRADHPGALLEILEEFTLRGVNLTRIESRPTGLGLGDYCFSVDCEGHIEDARVGEALMGLRRTCADVRFLGSYPRVGQGRTVLREGTTDRDFRDAQPWLARLRNGS